MFERAERNPRRAPPGVGGCCFPASYRSRGARTCSRYVRTYARVALPPTPSPCSPPPPSPFARGIAARVAPAYGTIAYLRCSHATRDYTARRRHMWGTSRNRARLYRRRVSHVLRDYTAYTRVRAVQTHFRAILIVRLRRVTPYGWRPLRCRWPASSVCVASETAEARRPAEAGLQNPAG